MALHIKHLALELDQAVEFSGGQELPARHDWRLLILHAMLPAPVPPKGIYLERVPIYAHALCFFLLLTPSDTAAITHGCCTTILSHTTWQERLVATPRMRNITCQELGNPQF